MFLKLQDLLQDRIRRSGMAPQMEASVAIEACKKELQSLFGSSIYIDARPVFIKKGILYIALKNSVISQEIALQEKKIVSNINAKIGRKAIKKISFYNY